MHVYPEDGTVPTRKLSCQYILYYDKVICQMFVAAQ